MEKPESIEYSSKWVTADEQLSTGACELIFALLTSDAQGNGMVTFYDGESTSERLLCVLEGLQTVSQPLPLPKPIYCRRGLYVDIGANVTGVLVHWHEIGR